MNIAEKLILSNNPIEEIWYELKQIYLECKIDDIQTYYKETEKQLLKLEEFLFKSYFELYQVELLKRIEKEELQWLSDITNNGNVYLVMDALSLREMGLLAEELKNNFKKVVFDYGFSALPSDTNFFRNKIKYDILKNSVNFYHLKEYDSIDLSGNENFIWSRYPDLLIENVRSGQSLKNDLEDVFKKTRFVIFTVLEKLNAEKVIICSDHGYLRTESSYNITINNETVKRWLRGLFDGSRFIKKEEADKNLAENLMNKNMIAETDEYYLPISHYSWPVSGAYSTFSHGGLSLLEVITPKITVYK